MLNLLIKLFIEFYKVGTFAFGGGYVIIAMLQSSLVGNGWITEATLEHIVAIAEMTPGPVSINAATFVGYTVMFRDFGGFFNGVIGSAIATAGAVLPSYILVILAYNTLLKNRSHKMVKGLFHGMRPVVAALIIGAAVSLGQGSINAVDLAVMMEFIRYIIAIIIIVGILIQKKYKLHILMEIGFAGLIGLIVL